MNPFQATPQRMSVPDSLDESDGSITSRSSFGVSASGYMPENIKRCKRKLKFAGFLCTYLLNVYLILNIFFRIYYSKR
jgi:hypothetical protein